jgi:hypothetical protein
MAEKTDDAQRTGRLSVADLHRAQPRKLFGGRSSGAACDLCRVLIGPNDPEYEVEAELDGATIALHFHVKCYDLWRGSRDSPADAAALDPPEAQPGSAA